MGQIIINPGSGPVDKATEENAIENMKHFLTDCRTDRKLAFQRFPDKDEDGRFCFMVYEDHWERGIHHWVDMPGLPLDKVRFVGSDDQNSWNFPRLYVDGSSWLWEYAILEEKDFVIEQDE